LDTMNKEKIYSAIAAEAEKGISAWSVHDLAEMTGLQVGEITAVLDGDNWELAGYDEFGQASGRRQLRQMWAPPAAAMAANIDAKALLAVYEDAVARRGLLASRKEELIADAIPDEVKAEIDGIEAELDPEINDLDAAIAALAKELKNIVASTGQKLVGDRHQVVYIKPRVTWDTKAIERYYAKEHPEIMVYKRPGKPSASIRVRK